MSPNRATRGAVSDDPLCRRCRHCPPAFQVARSLFAHEGPLREAIHALKYHGRRAAAAPLGLLLADQAPPDAVQGVEWLVPVPLHPERLVTRGFNQAELIARPVAARLGVSLLADGLRRVHQERAQAGLGAGTRQGNVYGAFVPGRQPLRGRVLLVDDVFSTGATADTCARALVAAGASGVVVLTLTRAILRWRDSQGETGERSVGKDGS